MKATILSYPLQLLTTGGGEIHYDVFSISNKCQAEVNSQYLREIEDYLVSVPFRYDVSNLFSETCADVFTDLN